MKIPFFALFILFIAWFTFKRTHQEKKDKNLEKNFWEKEASANSTRRKDISTLPFITIPLKELPFHLLPENQSLLEIENQIIELSQEKILNLTGYSNTDLKLMYGAPNLTLLTNYDQNFTFLVRLLNQWANLLYELSYVEEATKVLEYAIQWGSDIKSSYILLANIYSQRDQTIKITSLKESAKQLNSLMKTPILMALDSY